MNGVEHKYSFVKLAPLYSSSSTSLRDDTDSDDKTDDNDDTKRDEERGPERSHQFRMGEDNTTAIHISTIRK